MSKRVECYCRECMNTFEEDVAPEDHINAYECPDCGSLNIEVADA